MWKKETSQVTYDALCGSYQCQYLQNNDKNKLRVDK